MKKSGRAERRAGFRAGLWAGAALACCTLPPETTAAPLRVTATTTLVGDVVRRVGGEAVEVTVLIPPDADPHAWSPRPADVARLTRAEIVFVNGLGLEEALESILRMPEIAPHRVSVSEGMDVRRLTGACGQACGGSHGPAHGHAHEAGAPDPHVWFDPMRVQHWAMRIEETLAARRPERADDFSERRRALDRELTALDVWIREQTETLPEERRVLVSDHDVFGYFADRYGFRLSGAIVPGLSTLAQPSARDLARLQTRVREEGVRAVFVGVSANPVVAERLAADTGIRVVRLYTGSLSAPDGPAGDYMAFMRTNVSRIVQALR